MFEFLPIISSHSTPLFEYLRLSPNKTNITVILTLKLKKNWSEKFVISSRSKLNLCYVSTSTVCVFRKSLMIDQTMWKLCEVGSVRELLRMYVSMRWKMMDNKTPIMISKWWIIIQQKGMMLLWSSWGWWSTSFALNESYGVIWGHVQVVGLGWDLLHFLSKRPLVMVVHSHLILSQY
jgi:hypothetical protein